jgi:glutaredoxin
MATKRKIEVYSAGCSLCEREVEMVRSISCPSCEVTVLDMNEDSVSRRAKQLGIRAVPAVIIDGKLANCCTNTGPQIEVLRAAGIGKPL